MSLTLNGGILAGGAGRRMDGQDKALIELQGRPLAEYVADRLRPRVSRLLINTASEDPRYRELGDLMVPDSPEYQGAGPLAGMHALLSACDTEWMLILPCDAPLIPETALRNLVETAESARKPAVMRVRNRVNPVCCVLGSQSAPHLAAALRQGRKRTEQVILSLAPEFVDHDDDRPGLWSLNTAEELAACEQFLGAATG